MSTLTKSKFSAEEARELTEELKADYGALQLKIASAWRGRIWVALDYQSWQEYLDSEFSGVSLRPPKELEEQVIEELRAAGMSTRGIASATDISERTIRRRLDASGAANAAPDTPGRGGVSSPVVGLDGKEYRLAPPRREPEVIVDAEVVEDEPVRLACDLGLEPVPVDLSGRHVLSPEKVSRLISDLHSGGSAPLPMAKKRARTLESTLDSGLLDESQLPDEKIEDLCADVADAVGVLSELLLAAVKHHHDWTEGAQAADTAGSIHRALTILQAAKKELPMEVQS